MDFKLTIAQLAAEAAGKAFPGADVGVDAVAGMLETPPDAAMGDYALPCFKLSKALRKSPIMISGRSWRARFPRRSFRAWKA